MDPNYRLASNKVQEADARLTLRPYQQNGLDQIRQQFACGASRVLYTGSTGSGKTVLFAAVIDGAARRGKRCLITAHKIEIVEQISEALAALGVPHGVIAPGYPETPEPVQVASIASLQRRLERHDNYDLVVIDESHHVIAKTWRRIIDAMPSAKILGVTATPERADGRGLGDIFQTMVSGPSTGELIEGGFLSRYTVFAPEDLPDLSRVAMRAGDYATEQLSGAMIQPLVITSVVDEYQRRADGKRAIAFGVDRKHSQLLAERFVERGYRAFHIDGEMPRDERRRIVKALATGEVQIITNCGLISEGFDVPAVEAVLLARPTQSLALYLQMIGRSLRPVPGKDRALVLDLTGNVYRHGMPDAPREWSLEDKPRKQREQSDAPQARRCKACSAINLPKAITCTSCGAEIMTPIERREVETELRRIENLKQFETIRNMRYRQAVDWAGPDEARLRQVAMAKGYKRGWVKHALNEMMGVA